MSIPTKYIFKNGSPVPAGVCINPDHVEDVFTIKVSSCAGLTAGIVKDLIQRRNKVLKITHDEQVVVVRSPAQLESGHD